MNCSLYGQTCDRNIVSIFAVALKAVLIRVVLCEKEKRPNFRSVWITQPLDRGWAHAKTSGLGPALEQPDCSHYRLINRGNISAIATYLTQSGKRRIFRCGTYEEALF